MSVSTSETVIDLIFVPTAIVCWTLSVTGRFAITGAVFCCTFTVNIAVDEPEVSLHVIVIVYVFCVSKSNPGLAIRLILSERNKSVSLNTDPFEEIIFVFKTKI